MTTHVCSQPGSEIYQSAIFAAPPPKKKKKKKKKAKNKKGGWGGWRVEVYVFRHQHQQLCSNNTRNIVNIDKMINNVPTSPFCS